MKIAKKKKMKVKLVAKMDMKYQRIFKIRFCTIWESATKIRWTSQRESSFGE